METPVTEAPQESAPAPETAIDDAIADLLGTSKPAEPQQQETAAPKLEAMPSLLEDGPSIPADTQPRETATNTVKGLAENAGVDVKDLVFTFDEGDGSGPKDVSYTDVKKAYVASEALSAERLDFETTSREESNKLLNARREFESLVSMIPPESWPPQLVQRLTEQHTRTAEYETRMTLNAIPTWKDGTVMEADRADMKSYLAEWGYSDTEVDSVTDHRMLNFVRYHTRLVKRVAELEKGGHAPGKPQRASKTTDSASLAGLKRQRDSGAISGDQAASKWLKSIGV